MALVNCRECDARVSSEAEACPHCGVPYPAPADRDVRVGAEHGPGSEDTGTEAGATAGGEPAGEAAGATGGAGSQEAEASHGTQARTTTPEIYYRRVFHRFDQNHGRFLATWNWAAFIFAPFWYLAKGMWLKALLMFGILILTGGLAVALVWIYCGAFGNWDYYLLRRQGKQFY